MSKSTKVRPTAGKPVASKPVASNSGNAPTPQRMNGGMAIVAQLIANGVDTVFGLPGAQMYPFFDALHQRSDAIRTYGARHEQATAYMAFGYARATGRPGVCSVVPGPGVLNASAALATAMGACTPVLCVTGQVPSQFIGRGRGHLHELPDQLATMRSFVKWAARIERAADAPRLVNEAFQQMLTGRPGVVCLEMAWDTMTWEEDVTLLPPVEIQPAFPPAAHAIEAAAKILSEARHPIIFTGSGAQHAADDVRALADLLDAPVTAFRGGRGVVAEDHPLGISCATARALWPECDALIGIGTRLELPYMRWTGMMTMIGNPKAPPYLIRVDRDPAEMTRLVPHISVVADAADAARALKAAIMRLRGHAETDKAERTRRRAHIASTRARTREAIDKIQPQLSYLDVIRSCLPRDGIFVDELCQAGFTSSYGYPVYEPRTYISCGYQGTLGFGFPTALGVKAAHPDRPVVSITGDGGFLFGVQELATAAQEGIGLVTVLFNNSSYGNVMRDQQKRYANRVIGSELVNPDFELLAKSFAVAFARVHSPDELRPALKAAIDRNRAALIEVVIPRGSEVSPWEFITAY